MTAEENEERKEYLQQRSEYDKQVTLQSENLDKYLLALSSGAFGLSFLFIEKVLDESIIYINIIFYAWIMFTLTIITTLISFACSRHAHTKAIQEYDKMYENPTYEFKTPITNYFTNIFNCYSFGFLIIGLIAFIVFAYINIFWRLKYV